MSGGRGNPAVIVGAESTHGQGRWFSYTVLDASLVADARNNVFTLRNVAAAPVYIELAVVAFVNFTNKTVAFFGTVDGTLAGNGAFSATIGNAIQVSEGGTVSGGTVGPATVVGKDADRRTDLLGTGIVIPPGTDFSFECVPGAGVSGTVSVSTRWIELP